MMIEITLKYGTGEIQAVLSGGRYLGELRPAPRPEVPDLEQEISKGLREPIEASPVQDLARRASSVAIVISDHTRPLPSARILPFLCSELAQAGIPKDKLQVVIGVGNHRPVTEEEKERLLGPVYGQVRCVHSKETGYKFLGVTKRGTPVEVAAPVADADLVIGIGNVELHQLAGFTGGVKAVAAGTASPHALMCNHRLSRLKESGLGMLEGNVVRNDMVEFARIAKLQFIINVVLNEDHRVVHVAAGDPVKAHRSSCAAAERMYRVQLAQKADIVIVSPGGQPKDDTVYQAQKSVLNALQAAAPNAIIIVAAKCPEGFGDPEFERWMNQAASPEDILRRSSQEFMLGGHKGAFVAQAVRQARIFWVSGMEAEQVRKLFFEPYDSLQAAVDEALRIKGKSAGVMVIPYGGLTVPYSYDVKKAESEKSWAENTVGKGV